MSWIKSKADIVLLAGSVIAAFCLVELTYKYFPKREDSDRYALFSDNGDGTVFRNVEDFFVYEPNKQIRSRMYCFVNGNWVKEYDYIIPTNNLGLVQRDGTRPNMPSVLLLGDSFTEGQGTSPWFELFSKKFSEPDLQFINGGILGTGFQQWERLHDHLLTEHIVVKHLVVIFISDDYFRSVWNFSTDMSNCLRDYQRCVGKEKFFGMPADKDRGTYLKKWRAYRELALADGSHSFKERLEYFFPATTMIIRFLSNYLIPFKLGDLPQSRRSRQVIASLIARYKENILFVHLPQKEEVINRRINPIGYVIREDIKGLGGSLYDGQSRCNLTKEDYFVNDGHPNASGYAKISACVTAAVKDKWSLQ